MKSERRKAVIREFAVHFPGWEQRKLGTGIIACFLGKNCLPRSGGQACDRTEAKKEGRKKSIKDRVSTASPYRGSGTFPSLSSPRRLQIQAYFFFSEIGF